MERLGKDKLSARARPPIVAGLLCLLCAAALALAWAPRPAAAAPIEPPEPGETPPSFVVLQTDDQTLDGLYETFRAFPGAAATRTMPNTLDLIGKRGMTFNRYYVPYPLCCPSRTSLLTGRYSHSNGVRGNNQPNGGFTGFSFRAAATHNIATWLQGAGYRTIHAGKFLNGYGDPPYDDGTSVPPGWDAWYGIVNADTHHYFYGYTLNINGQLTGPFGDPGSWETREYGIRDDFTCPQEPINGPCNQVDDKMSEIARGEMLATPRDQPFYVQIDYAGPHGDFRRPAGPEPAPRHYDWFKGVRHPHNRSEGFDEGNVGDKPRFIREAPHLTPIE
jgi:arylsulfatase A-like enzyme